MSMAHLKIVKPHTEAERARGGTVDTWLVTKEQINSWLSPPFQRPLRVNAKLLAVVEKIKREDGVIPGVLEIGILGKDKYLLDGQHRRHAFLLSECPVGYCDVRIGYYDSIAEMGVAFDECNSSIVSMRPDDTLRALEGSIEPIALIRRKCPFVGFDQVRRGSKSPIISMSALLRCWSASAREVPSGAGHSARQVAMSMTLDEAERCVEFLKIAERAWGRDPEYDGLWKSLNLTLSMWLYRRTVLAPPPGRSAHLSGEVFCKYLMALSANDDYVSWLLGRNLGERDRSPCYMRIKRLFVKRAEQENGTKLVLLQPAWAHNAGRTGRVS